MSILNTIELSETLFVQVEQAKQQWEAAVDALPELIVVVDDMGRIIRANRAAEQWLNISVTEVTGRHLHQLFHSTCQTTCYLHALWRRLRQEGREHQLVTLQTYDPVLKKHLLIRARHTGHGKKNGRLNSIVIIQDISKQYAMEQVLRNNAKRFEVLNAISQSVLHAQTPEQIAQFVLKHLHQLIPYTVGAIAAYDANQENFHLIGVAGEAAHQPNAFNPEFMVQLVEKSADMLTHTQIVDGHQVPDGVARMLNKISLETMRSVWLLPLEIDKRPIGLMILAHRQPHAFNPSQQAIIDEVTQLLIVGLRQAWFRSRLEQSNENLQNLIRANQEHMQTVSHELRSPLAIIKGYTEMLHEGLLGPLTPDQQNVLAILDSKGNQLLHLVQSLFTLQTVSRETLQREDVNLHLFLQELVQSWKVLANNKEIVLTLEADPQLPMMSVDRTLLNQAISNLLDNAIKYSEAGDRVMVSAENGRSEIIISVKDEGAGIPRESLENVFHRYYQVSKKSVQAKLGAGIGLALCHAIITAHAGKIWAESEGVGQGTTFFISLPNTMATRELSM